MNVILKENVDTLGSIGEIVRVSSGYARNFLFPKNLAVMADQNNISQVEHQKRALTKKLAKIKSEKEALKAQLEGLSIVLRRKAGENQKLFGSITNQDIAEQLEQKNFKIDRRNIELDSPIKKLGSFKVPVRLMEGVIAELNISVVADVE
ncbi:MAG: 50S ribosomal protein L9 [Oligoflexia bacterium]|nr:50S ribosomal protein L9 [Oligoflexia bacterium]